MRLFVAVWPDDVARRALRRLALPTTGGLRVVPPEQWHVTLRFLGEVDGSLLPAISSALRSSGADERPRVATMGPATAWFGRGAVLQVPVRGLEPLAERVRAATSELVPRPEADEPPFNGHLTLARSRRRRHGRPDGATRAALAGIEISGRFRIEGLDLVESVPAEGGPRYLTRQRVRLGGTSG